MMVLVVVLFVARTAHSVRGGLWQAIAQAAVGEIKGVLDGVTRLPDGKVAGLIRSRGLSKVDVSTRVDAATGEMRLVRREAIWRGMLDGHVWRIRLEQIRRMTVRTQALPLTR